ncbi:proteinase B [Saitoella coloradoensis]
MKLSLTTLVVALTSATVALASPAPSLRTSIVDGIAPLFSASTAETIDNSYIVVFHPHVESHHASTHHEWVSDCHSSYLQKRGQTSFSATDAEEVDGEISTMFSGVKHVYDFANGALRGYAGSFSDEVLEQIRSHPDVAYVERDQLVHTTSVQRGAPWGLSRISHRDALTFSTFNKYQYDSVAGDGVTAYIIDTGVNIDHVDFEGRAKWGATIPQGDQDIDGNGHGTHVAGTVAGSKYGVAKKANVVAVKVLRTNGSGTMSDVLKGVEWAAEDHIKRQTKAKKDGKPFKGSTANMSLGGGKSRTLDVAVNAAVDAGLHFAVAAGNDNADACSSSPAAAEGPITVGASTLSDERAYFSNHGKCVDIFAPGLNILSTWIGSKVATNTISGTSMASPHICGLLTYFLSLVPSENSTYHVPITPKKLKARMISMATPGKLGDIPSGTPNLLAYNEFANGGKKKKVDGDRASRIKEAFEEWVSKVEETIEDEVRAFSERFEVEM